MNRTRSFLEATLLIFIRPTCGRGSTSLLGVFVFEKQSWSFVEVEFSSRHWGGSVVAYVISYSTIDPFARLRLVLAAVDLRWPPDRGDIQGLTVSQTTYTDGDRPPVASNALMVVLREF